MAKKIEIKIFIEGDKIATMVSKDGIGGDASGILEMVGILESLKQKELRKLDMVLREVKVQESREEGEKDE